MRAYLSFVHELSKQFDQFALVKIPRNDNSAADALATLASNTNSDLRRTIPVKSIAKPSIELPGSTCVIIDPATAMDVDVDATDAPNVEVDPEPSDWRDSIKMYIADGIVPTDRWEARRMKTKAANYMMLDGELYRQSATRAFLTCVDQKEALTLMKETNDGDGGNHSGGRALALKIK